MKRFIVSLGMSILVVSALAGCGPDDDTETETSNANNTVNDHNETGEPEKPDSLEIWANDDEYQFAAVQELVSQFEDEYGIEVEVTAYLMADQDEAFALDAPGGIGPDVIFQPHDRLGDLTSQNLLAPLEVDEDTLAEYTEEAVTAFTLDGEVYGAPLVMENTALYYNKDLIDAVPETMDELYELADSLTDASHDEYGFLFEALNFYHVYPWIGGYGGYVFSQDDEGNYNIDDIGLDNDGAVEAYEEVQSLFERGILPRSVDEDVINGLFTDGKVAMAVSGPWAMASYSEALGDSLGVAPLPELSNGNTPTPFAGVKGWLVSNYSENTYWASQLALYLSTADAQSYYYEETGEIPARPDATVEDEFAEAFLEQSQSAEPMPNIPEMGQVWDPMEDSLQFNAEGQDPGEILEEAVEEIHDYIDMMN
ncbi:extracellular solute-binding protein [Salipaludibacillus agaradhaerens]|jgi:arabinogalactan oligomer/maltooligosaccharide transport system substrate-binding protein|uniref:Maltodextrin-binding protein n=1 Tax=Salipaludibacillus agaradhaerens TaxID=76935 RepID=A0A9Q4B327_SALAG|nr:extracellular solute-binding protein [Salipaludibacillus agaradhaerens]MCR6097235.1 extracellular solute-binding protein [Salipaludibacillus agaradhaerens]MCR6105943.1 extracellular solute-binding protein [Salipaludibacillus agaradhaerens]MCR6113280.1 extracellular solute-binding protein [Salipaludibacillus agaradhaerens]MCR6117976.1 extracellular solute-binding protein [Salipaludibacillus agaradhaerens]